MQYARDASLELQGFFREDKYAELHAALQTQRWEHAGPAIVCSYKVSHDTATEAAATARTTTTRKYNGIAPDAVYNAFRFLTGSAFRTYIGVITGSDLAAVTGQVRCFAHGDYTLVCDPAFKAAVKQAKADKIGVSLAPATATAASASAGGAGAAAASPAARETGDAVTGSAAAAALAASTLIDVTLACVAAEEWPDEHGGYISYLTTDDELLTVNPKQNALSIVCR